MIVTCASCQTRFRIPDEKIGPRGARVRCSRCQALFLVRRDDAPAAPPPAAAPATSPGAPAPGTAALELELTGDPFALRTPRARPPADPFAATPPDPFAAAPPPDPFAATAAAAPFPGTPLPFGPPPAGDPFAGGTPVPSDGGIALEEAEGRQRATAAPSLADIGQAELAADFRTPGPSGLEVDDRRTPPQALAAEAERPPTPPPVADGPAAPAALAPPTASMVVIPRPAASPLDDGTAAARPAAVRRALAVLVNSLSLALLLVLAAALYVYWTGGGMAGLRAALGRPAEAPFEERDVTSGLYDTVRGRPVLFIRGRVQSRAAVGVPVRVRVELLDGKRKVAQGEGLLGALPSPEEIWSLTGPAEAERLRAELAARAPAHLAAGEARPFLVVLWDYPADMRGLDLKVVAEPAPPG